LTKEGSTPGTKLEALWMTSIYSTQEENLATLIVQLELSDASPIS
jgi:hypothetical protein